jgi:glycosyltransferase involved in cell wall biosynthesis
MDNKKTKIVYFGNKQEKNKSTTSVMETLVPLWSKFSEVKSYSSLNNKILKMIDFIFHFFKDGLKAHKIVIDVYSTSAFYFAFILSFLSIVFNKKYMLFLHGGNLPNRQKQNPKLVEFIFSKAHKIVAPSYYLKSYFEEKGFQIEYIPNSIDLKKYTFQERKAAKLNLLSLRGFGKPYNPIMTLEAVSIIAKKIPSVKLCLIGNEDEYYYEDVVNFINQNKLNEHVSILPKMSQAKWIALSTNYDIMISNPDIDNTPISVLEGMALGMCIITTNVGGIPFLLQDKNEAIFVNKNNAQELVDAIYCITENEIISNNLSKNARKKAETFDWELLKTKWETLLLN